MKKPKYKKGDFIKSNSPPERSGFIKYILENVVCITPDTRYTDTVYVVTTRKGKREFIGEKEIIRKLPILRDSRGRFSKKEVIYRNGVGFIEKDCTCYNCEKCEKQMRAYYEKTGELKKSKPKTWADLAAEKQKEWKEDFKRETGLDPDIYLSKSTEDKKPSERMGELFDENKYQAESIEIKLINAITQYLDECWEKGK